MKLLVLQTSDPKNYFPLLKVTSSINKEYCKRWNHEHLSYVGIVKGSEPWNACYNRIFLLRKLILKNYDWILYLDADAMIMDMEWNIENFLENYKEKGLIVSQGADLGPWDINNGVMFINCKNKDVCNLFSSWEDEFTKMIGDDKLSFQINKNNNWDSETMPIYDDQFILQKCLVRCVDKKTMTIPFLHRFVGDDKNLINYDGIYIKQILRKNSEDINVRLKIAELLRKKVIQKFNLDEKLLGFEPITETMEDVN